MRDEIPNIELSWTVRAERVARSQARTNPSRMTRPARDPDERRFLASTEQLGPFVESVVVRLPFGRPPE